MTKGVYEYIKIETLGTSKSGKTGIFQVKNIRSNEPLGEIRWWARWRQYVFLPYRETIYSVGCMNDISDFIRRQSNG